MTAPADCVDVAIVGGGPAGLSAALVLGRCRRRVVVFDSGVYRNARAHAVHGFLTRDGIPPEELRRLARAEIGRYDAVEFRDALVNGVVRENESSFVVHAEGRAPLTCRKLLLATGLIDELPRIAGAEELFGDGVHSCPYCDAWEFRDKPLVSCDRGGSYSTTLLQWSRELVVCSNGPAQIDGELLRRFDAMGVAIDERPIARFERDERHVRVIFEHGEAVRCRAVFVNARCRPRSDLAAKLGCKMDEQGGVCVDRHESTSVPGVYVAGDASRDALQAIVAAGEGAAAAMAINSALIRNGLARDG